MGNFSGPARALKSSRSFCEPSSRSSFVITRPNQSCSSIPAIAPLCERAPSVGCVGRPYMCFGLAEPVESGWPNEAFC
eukprot:10146891-Alexandrium_andersonii.AAC.1